MKLLAHPETKNNRRLSSSHPLGDAGEELIFEASTIRDVAAKHLRFALALASFNLHGGLRNRENKMQVTPLELSAQEIEWWMLPMKEAAPHFKELAEKRQAAGVQTPLKPVIYEITVEDVAGSNEALLRLRVRSPNLGESDPPYTALDMQLAPTGTTLSGKRLLAVKSWRIN